MKRIKEFVVDYIERKGSIPIDCDIDSFNYVKSGHIDSMGVFKFLIDIESEFGIEMSDDDLLSQEFMTIGGLVSIISRKRK